LSPKVRRKPFDAASEWHQIAPPYSSARVVASACKGQESDRRRRELKVACGGAFTDKYGKRISVSQFESFSIQFDASSLQLNRAQRVG
jgi:hypothetical protein